MNQDFFKQKIKAFLHDPPEKPLVLGLGAGHESRSREYVAALLGEQEPFDKDAWQFADHVASAADRLSFPMRSPRDFMVGFRKHPILKHPNSGATYKLSPFGELDADALKENVLAIMHEIRDRAEGDPEKMFLYLWRCFPEIARSVETGHQSLGYLWDYLPADTRIPDHSVLDHSRMVSAFAGAGIQSDKVSASMMLFTIGPVQEFIAAARKTSDLWSGSYMLSWLSWQAMKVFCDTLGPDSILFPDLIGQPLVDNWLKTEKGLEDLPIYREDLKLPTLPNRFFAIVPQDRAEELAVKAEQAVRDGLVDAGRFAFSQFKKVMPDNAPNFDVWERQLSGFTECYWACLDLPDWKQGETDLNDKFSQLFSDLFFLDGSEEKKGDKHAERESIYQAYAKGGFKPNMGTFYGRFYEIVEKSVGARKSLRNFDAAEEPGYRCSLIPGLAALTPQEKAGNTPKPGTYNEFWKQFYARAQKNRLGSKLGKNERLSPLALTKRQFTRYLSDGSKTQPPMPDFGNDQFISTHSLAVADFRYQLLQVLEDTKSEALFDALESFLEASDDFRSHLNLDNEVSLAKMARVAASLSFRNLLKATHFCNLPGELFQRDYYDGAYIGDVQEVEKFEDKHDSTYRNEVKKLANNALKALLKLIRESGLQPPSKYYAILYLDGDDMGKWLSGDNGPEFCKVLHPEIADHLVDGIENPDKFNHDEFKGWARIFVLSPDGKTVKRNTDKSENKYTSSRRPQAPTQHLSISRALNNYSLNIVRDIVEQQFLGKLVYAGGDDVVAMLSIGDALECAETLRAGFSGHLKGDQQKELKDLSGTLAEDKGSKGYVVHKSSKRPDTSYRISATLGPTATASCGMTVSHYMYPLKQAMADARKAEKYSKNKLGRDAFAVNIVKRSGESFITGAKWRLKKQHAAGFDLIASQVLQRFAKAIHSGYLTSKFINDVEQSLDVLVSLPEKAVLAEFKRLYYQHNEGFGQIAPKDDETPKQLKERIRSLKESFFEETIAFLVEQCKQLVGQTATMHQHKTRDGADDWPALRNVVHLMDMAYYIGKGGGR